MAAVYRRRAKSPRVSVRTTGRGRTLLVDGTFASWYEPGGSPRGTVWEALALPLLALPPAQRRRVLILGLGGGSAAHWVRRLAPRARIVGVELDPAVVRAARRWFDLEALGIEVVEGDARRYLEDTRRRFDAVLEDVFVGRGRAVRKPAWLPAPGLGLARRRVDAGGIVVSNALDEAPAVGRELRRLFPQVARIEVEGYDNRIFVGGRRVSGLDLRRRVEGDALFAPAAARLRFRSLP